MKRIVYIAILLVLPVTFFSCRKFLEVKPVEAVSDEVTINDRASAETALRGAYRALGSNGYYGENYVTLGYFPSGDIVNLTTGGAANLVNINFRTDEVSFSSSWDAIYIAINRANHVIEKVPAVQDPQLTTALKNQYVGEAKFIRALAYFDLARAWGGVQLILIPTTSLSDRPRIARSTLAETYAQVQKDLEDAEALLPNDLNRIRATKRTVWALRARLHLYKKEWALAEEYASKLIALSSDYELLKPYSAWFANNALATRESIFELQFSAQNPSSLRDQMAHPASKQSGTYRYAPNDRFVELLRNTSLSGGRRALIDSVKQGATVLWFGSLYYRNPSTDPTYIFRIAEMHLIRAEARAQLGNDLPGAIDDLNLIRQRAEIANTTATTKEEILLAIENERRVEFAWEGHRWFDLARTGRAKEVLEALDSRVSVEPHELLFPIPINQIQLDPELKQNPGYQ